jgi:hypothetical protein
MVSDTLYGRKGAVAQVRPTEMKRSAEVPPARVT